MSQKHFSQFVVVNRNADEVVSCALVASPRRSKIHETAEDKKAVKTAAPVVDLAADFLSGDALEAVHTKSREDRKGHTLAVEDDIFSRYGI